VVDEQEQPATELDGFLLHHGQLLTDTDSVLGAPRCPPVEGGKVERETGFEPATFCLGSRHSAS
jgi:hypothetical protein